MPECFKIFSSENKKPLLQLCPILSFTTSIVSFSTEGIYTTEICKYIFSFFFGQFQNHPFRESIVGSFVWNIWLWNVLNIWLNLFSALPFPHYGYKLRVWSIYYFFSWKCKNCLVVNHNNIWNTLTM